MCEPFESERAEKLSTVWRPSKRCIGMPQNIVRLGLIARLFRNFKLLFPLIRDYWKGTYTDVSIKSIVIFLAGLAYILSPLDVIPDYVFGPGQIDDAAILGVSLFFLEKELLKYQAWRDGNRQR